MKRIEIIYLIFLILFNISCSDEIIEEDIKPPVTPIKLSNNQYLLSWKTDGAPPRNFIIERKTNNGSWVVIDDNYIMPDPFEDYKFTGINTNFYFIDENLISGDTITYRINGEEGNPIILTGSTYYVKNGGNDNADGLSDENAWATVSKAVNTATSPGDLVLFKRGDTFTTGSTLLIDKGSGTIENPIRWSAYGFGNKPIFNLTNSIGLSIRDVSNRIFDHLDFRGSSFWNIEILAENKNMSNIKLLNLKTDGSNQKGVVFSSCIHIHEKDASVHKTSAYYVTDVEIAYCVIANTGGGIGNTDGIRPWAVKGNCHIHNNLFTGGGAGGDGIDLGGGIDHVLEYNEIKNGTYGKPSGSGIKVHGQQWPLENIIIRRNLIYYTGQQNYGITLQDSKNGLVEYNTCYQGDKGWFAFSLYAKNQPSDVIGNVVKNNIFYGSNNSKLWTGAVKITIYDELEDQIWGDIDGDHLGMDWYNKVMFSDNCIKEGTDGAIICLFDKLRGSTYIDDSTNFWTDWKGIYGYSTDINEDPKFVNPEIGDFRLQEDSPAKRMGFTSDIDY